MNPGTDQVYVTNRGSEELTIIDGATLQTETVAGITDADRIAFNSKANKIYVSGAEGTRVTVLDAVDYNQTPVTVGHQPYALCVNPFANKTYCTAYASGRVYVINSGSNGAGGIGLQSPEALACTADSVSNRAYVTAGWEEGFFVGSIMVIDGATNARESIKIGRFPTAVVANPVTDSAYALDFYDDTVTVVDGEDLTFDVIDLDAMQPRAAAVNPVTNKIYVTYGQNLLRVIDGTDNTTGSVAVGSMPRACVTNPKDGVTYVADRDSDTVSVIARDGSVQTVAVAQEPVALAVNPRRNEVYVVGFAADAVTVIDGDTLATQTIATGDGPVDVAIDAVANRAYVANSLDDTVTIIDVIDRSTAPVTVGDTPGAIAVNPASGRAYVADTLANTVTVVDGSDGSTETIPVGNRPRAIAIDPDRDRIYVANESSGNVTVIDGADHSTQTVFAGSGSRDIAVNGSTNKIYVANTLGNSVTVIDGDTFARRTIVASGGPRAIEVNRATNRIYVARTDADSVLSIDGSDESVEVLPTGAGPRAISVDPIANRAYVANQDDGTVTVVTEVERATIPLTVSIGTLANDVSFIETPTFEFEASSTRGEDALPVRQIYYQMDSWTGAWTAADESGPSASATMEPLAPGLHILYAYAADDQFATSSSPTPNATVHVGDIAAYPFFVVSTCGEGSVNSGAGPVSPVLSVNGATGSVEVGVGHPLALGLSAAPEGPSNGRYVLYLWPGFGSSPVVLDKGGEQLGCTVRPTPLDPGLMPQPKKCMSGAGIPAGACGTASPLSGPAFLPVDLTHPGAPNPAVFTLQAVIEDDGASNALGFSVSNAVVIVIE